MNIAAGGEFEAFFSAAAEAGIARRLLGWWDANRRELPWRSAPGVTPDAYRVWLSEVLLQQTTTTAVTPYYAEFLRRWPNVEALAAAELEEITSAFAGLGYYTRVRNLHACAKAVAARGGIFPSTEVGLLALPGVGPYTAAAIAAIAFGERAAPVDGNIARILSRLAVFERPIAESRVQLKRAAEIVAPADRPGDFAQALMDVGAGICRPKNPRCDVCPLSESCRARMTGRPEDYPRKSPRRERPPRYGAAFRLLSPKGEILVRRRPAKGLLASTLELPGTDWTTEVDRGSRELLSAAPVVGAWTPLPEDLRHVFTHFDLTLKIFVTRTALQQDIPADTFWLPVAAVPVAGFSGLMLKAVEMAARFDGVQ